MRESTGISEQGEQTIQDFIYVLNTLGNLNPKTLKEYASDLKHFISWFEKADHPEEDVEVIFRVEEVAVSTLIRYRDYAQKVMKLKPATINRRLITLKRFFEWAMSESRILRDPSKPIKLIPEERVSPRQMTDKEEAALLSAAKSGGSYRDHTILIVMLNTGLRTMELCNLAPGDIQIGTHSAQLIVRSGKLNKQREVPLNDTCRFALEKYLESLPPDSQYLFPSEKTGDRLTERALRHLIQKYVKASLLEGISAHDLRHRFGYVMVENTPLHRLAQIMGHDNLNTTMIYVKAMRADSKLEVEKTALE
ncbi:tyrosine-type recombinase/integrase [Paenibacillus shunpengii]|uniref:Tyrosine-type recombinase/integrase n=1 Tax=Paenibacillus shunpengii TaxID=2054424 RepID=A0ABW5SMS7_9BACL